MQRSGVRSSSAPPIPIDSMCIAGANSGLGKRDANEKPISVAGDGFECDSKPGFFSGCFISSGCVADLHRLITPGRLRLAALLPDEAHAENQQAQPKQAQLTRFGYRDGYGGGTRLVYEVRYEIKVGVVGERSKERQVKEIAGSHGRAILAVVRSKAGRLAAASKQIAAIRRSTAGGGELKVEGVERSAGDVGHEKAPPLSWRVQSRERRTVHERHRIGSVDLVNVAGCVVIQATSTQRAVGAGRRGDT